MDGHLDGRAIKDNDYGGWEVRLDFLFLLMSVGERGHVSIYKIGSNLLIGRLPTSSMGYGMATA